MTSDHDDGEQPRAHDGRTLPEVGGRASGTWTVLFTDIAHSTSIRTDIGEDAFDSVRERHDSVLRQSVESNHGRIVKYTGDGCMAVFEGAAPAVAAGVQIQQAFERRARTSSQPIQVRIGISLGDAVTTDDDLHGLAVVEAARLCARAAPGQVLCSDVVRVAAGSRGGHRFGPVTTLSLAGIPDPVPVVEARWEPAAGPVGWPRFGVLGPLVIERSDGPVAISGTKERQVLAALLVDVNQPVPVGRLVECLWADSPPRSAERTLHVYVSRLRRALEPDRSGGSAPTLITTVDRGYQLSAEPDQVDAGRFLALVASGRRRLELGEYEVASAELREGLDLWRGEPYEDLPDAERASLERTRLVEHRLLALESRIEADLAAGLAGDLVPELEQVVTEHPFHESFWGQLMVALYHAGRQSDALRTFQRARRALDEELGLEPGPRLRELEAAILVHDVGVLGAPRGPQRALPDLALPPVLERFRHAFFGREVELAGLSSAWTAAVGGRGPVRLPPRT